MHQADYQKTKETFINYLKSKGFTTKSIQSRMVGFNQYLKWLAKENPSGDRAGLEAEQAGYTDLLLFMKSCQHKEISQRTIQHYMGAIHHFYEHLLQEEKVIINPVSSIVVKGVKRKMLYHILEPFELHHIYNKYPVNHLQDRRNKVLLGLLVYQGLKAEELARLEVKDVQLRKGEITVPGGRRSNGRVMKLEVHQVMDMNEYVLQVREQLLQMKPGSKSQTKAPSDKLFIRSTTLHNLMAQLMGKVRKQHPAVLNTKQIRASVITKWLKNPARPGQSGGYNLREVQYLAGHRYISSTESFLQNETEGLAKEINQYHPLG